MSAEPFETCRQCGGSMQRASKENESPLIMQCEACAHREYAEIQIPPDGFFPNEEVEYKRVIVCRNVEKATAEEILALRKLIPDLAALPISEAAKKIATNRNIYLGSHLLKDAQLLLEKAEASGLKALLEDPGKETIADQVKHGFFEPFGAPVTVGQPGEEETTIIPFGWILIGVVLIVVILVVVLF